MTTFGFDEYELDTGRLELKREGEPIRADRMILRLLTALVQDAGKLVTKAELMARVWDRRAVSENVISVSIARLRKTLGHRPGEREFVVSVQGRGYRFVRPVTVLEHSGAAAPESTSSAPDTGPAFVGREPVMSRLHAALAAAREGRGGVCLLTGEPGIGKTAVAERLAVEAEARGLDVVWAYCQEVGEAPPLWPFAQLVRALLAREKQQGQDAEARAPELRWLLPELAHEPVGDARPGTKHRIFEAILGVLERAATPKSLVLIIDDLHRADAASLELLRYWMNRIAHTKVLLVATLRLVRGVQSLASVDLSYVVGHRNCSRIALNRLELAAVQTYVTSILPDVDGTLAHAVWAKSEGNPFFMVELARQLSDVQRPSPDALAVGEEALQLLKPRVLELDAATRGLLSCAAVIGRRFELGLLQKVTERDLATLTAHLDEAVASETVIAAADASTAYAFGHELIRKLLYDALTPQARRRLHLKVAETLAQLAGQGEVVPSAVLAYHFHAALPESCPTTTLGYCQRAAVDATFVFAHADSLRYLQYALEALSLFAEPSPKVRLMLLFQQAVAARVAGEPGFEQLVFQAADVARALRSGSFMIDVAMLLHLHPGFPTPPRARALLEEGIAMLPPDDTLYRGAALARLATCGPVAFDAARSRAQVERALALVKVTDALLPAYNAHSAAHYLASGPAQGEASARSAGELERLCRANPHMLRIAPTLLDLHAALVAHQTGQLEAASSALARMTTRCHEMGTREFTWYLERYQLLARLQYAEPDTIAADLRALHERARRESIVGSELMCMFDEVVVLEDAQEPDLLRQVLAYSVDDPPSIWSIKAQTLAAAGLREEASAALYAVSADALAALPHDRDYVGTLGALSHAAIALAARDHIEALYTLLTPHAEYLAVHVSFLCLGPVAQVLGELASALGWRSDAVTHFDHAARLSDRLGLLIHGAAARRALATLSYTTASASGTAADA